MYAGPAAEHQYLGTRILSPRRFPGMGLRPERPTAVSQRYDRRAAALQLDENIRHLPTAIFG